jgi:hypothetical protein
MVAWKENRENNKRIHSLWQVAAKYRGTSLVILIKKIVIVLVCTFCLRYSVFKVHCAGDDASHPIIIHYIILSNTAKWLNSEISGQKCIFIAENPHY